MPCGIRPSNVRVCHFTTRAAWGKSESGTQESKQTDQLQKGRSQNKSGKQEPRKASKRTSFTKTQNQNQSGKQEPRRFLWRKRLHAAFPILSVLQRTRSDGQAFKSAQSAVSFRDVGKCRKRRVDQNRSAHSHG